MYFICPLRCFFCMKNKKNRTNQPTTANWTVNADFQLQMFSCCVLLSGNNKKQLLSDCFVLNFGCHCIVLSPDGEMCNINTKNSWTQSHYESSGSKKFLLQNQVIFKQIFHPSTKYDYRDTSVYLSEMQNYFILSDFECYADLPA